VLLTLEKNVYGKFLERTHILKHAYIIFIIPLTWMVFAITDMHQLGTYFTRLFPFLTAFHGLHLPAQSCLQYAMFPCRLQPEMCVVWKHLCLARRDAVWYVHGRQRDSSPPERMSWPRPVSGSFFRSGFTGHKKRPDLIRGGPYPLELPRGALSVSLPHLDDRQQKEPPAEAEGSSFGLFCFGRWKPDQAAFLALACAASALLPSTTRSMARMTSRMARIARM
jgi:hypothetical protein